MDFNDPRRPVPMNPTHFEKAKWRPTASHAFLCCLMYSKFNIKSSKILYKDY